MNLQKTKFRPLTSNELKPKGWLKRQLEIQRNGLSGNLDKVWPDVKDSSWIGGNCEGWERVPYWLDGAVPLAYILEDEDFQKRVDQYINAILERQCEDGWICPCSEEERNDYDVWATFLICKVLVVYYECTNDTRIEDAVYKALKQLKEHIEVNTLFRWSAARWYEALIPLYWLYERKPEAWMIDLVHLLKSLGIDYHALYEKIDFKKKEPKKYWNHVMHVVNVAMAIKSDALMSRITGDEPNKSAKKYYENIMRNHSMVTGHFTGDECLAGDSPTQGSECCSVVEAMYSYEKLIEIGGDVMWSDLLERLTFNCLPATVSPDMWTHQYVQMTNQNIAKRIPDEKTPFGSNCGDAHNFGLETHFGCCTSNFNQGFPKYALSTIMKSDNGVAITSYAPSVAYININNTDIVVEQETMYPFRDNVKIIVKTDKEVAFDLLLRVPNFAKGAKVDGVEVKVGAYHKITRKWSGMKEVNIDFTFDIEIIDRPYHKKAIKRGPFVYSLPISEKWEKVEYVKNGVERKFPYCDYEISPTSNWNYAFASDEFEVKFKDISDIPFSNLHAPIEIITEMVQIEWEDTDGICNVVSNEDKVLSKPEKVSLIPYGSTNLRMTEMPFVK